jgi:hypothetical protein
MDLSEDDDDQFITVVAQGHKKKTKNPPEKILEDQGNTGAPGHQPTSTTARPI